MMLKRNKTRTEHRNSALEAPLVSTCLSNFLNEDAMANLTRKERHLYKKQQTHIHNAASIVIGSKVNLNRSNHQPLQALPLHQPDQRSGNSQPHTI